jgi:hypothetical protein
MEELQAAYKRVARDMANARVVAGALVEGGGSEGGAAGDGNAGSWINVQLMLEEVGRGGWRGGGGGGKQHRATAQGGPSSGRLVAGRLARTASVGVGRAWRPGLAIFSAPHRPRLAPH